MLIGQYHTSISSKGRTAVPTRLRRDLGEVVIVTRWYEGSLALFSISSWEKIQKDILEGASLTGAFRGTERFLFGGAYEAELDEQGRFVIPQTLRIYAGFISKIVFLGIKDRVEIWDEGRWSKLEENITKRAEILIEQVQKEKAEIGK